MRTIWKYFIDQKKAEDVVQIDMPKHSKVIKIDWFNGPHMWVEVHSEYPTVVRTFHIVGTGHRIPPWPAAYVGSYITSASEVFHVYE